MRLHWPAKAQALGKYGGELLIVAAGVALGLWATQWAENREIQLQVNDAYDVLADELGDNLWAVRYRSAVSPCVQRRIADLRRWNDKQSRGGGAQPIPLDIGTPGSLTILDSVWDVSKAGQVVARMPLEVRRRYAAVYDLFENVATFQRLERDVWFSIGDYGGLTRLSDADRARLNGLLNRAESFDQSLTGYFPGIASDLSRLKVEKPNEEIDLVELRKRAICQPFAR